MAKAELAAVPDPEEARDDEDSYLATLLGMVEPDVIDIEVPRGDDTLLTFRVRSLDEEEMNACRDRASKKGRTDRRGRVVEQSEFDATRFQLEMILAATLEPERSKIWHNKKAWSKMGVLSSVDMVNKLLRPGERNAIFNRIWEISGYSYEVEDTLKN